MLLPRIYRGQDNMNRIFPANRNDYSTAFIKIIILFACVWTAPSGQSDPSAGDYHIPDTSTVVDTTANQPEASPPEPPCLIDTSLIIPSLDFSGIGLRGALTALIRAYRLSIFIDTSVSGTVSMRLENVSLNDALLFIIKEFHLAWEKTGGIIKIFRPKAEPPPPPPLDMSYSDGRFSCDLADTDLNRFAATVIDITGKNIILEGGTHGIITGRLVDIDFEKGLQALLNSNGFTLSRIDGIYHIDYLEAAADGSPRSRRYNIYCEKDSVTIDVRHVCLSDILAALAEQCGLNLIIHGDIAGHVTASYRKKPVADVLAFVLRGTAYTFKKDGGIFHIGDKNSEELFTSKLIRLNHIGNASLQDLMPATLLKLVSFKPVNIQNGFIATGPYTAILEIEDFIREIDIPPAQVLFEVIVVDYNISDMSEFRLTIDNTGQKQTLPDQSYYPGIDISGTGKDLNDHLDEVAAFLDVSNIGRLSDDFFLRLQIMQEEGVANIRSRPQIAALNGHPASLQIGTSQYYLLESRTIYPSQQTSVSTQTSQRFEVIEADMSLEVTPWVTAAGEIIVIIKPEFNNPLNAFDPDVPPTINRRILKSTVRLKNGETIVLGGMIQDNENITIRKLPILGSLPIIGRIFQNRNSVNSKSELMVYITPHVYYGSEKAVDIDKILEKD